MLVILYQDGCEALAANGRADIAAAFNGHVQVEAVAAAGANEWPTEPAWDDLLVIVYNKSEEFPDTGNRFIESFVRQRPDSGMLLPVAIDPAFRKPPRAAEGVKALEYDANTPGVNGRLVKRAGGMLGLRVQGRDAKIFISYRATDGAAIATQLHDYLATSGHRAFLDEAKEADGEGSILPGRQVQAEIEEALKAANLVLLIDTPEAPESRWIRREVDVADSLILPILPICFRKLEDRKPGPRFPSLLALQRWLQLPLPDPANDIPLTDDQLEKILSEVETYLCDIFQRKCRVPFIVKREFVSREYAWAVLSQPLMMYESSKAHSSRLTTKVCSHCSIFDQIYMPALKRFVAFLEQTDRRNFALFIYDGDLLPKPQLDELAAGEADVIILHHQELAILIDSNFTLLKAA